MSTAFDSPCQLDDIQANKVTQGGSWSFQKHQPHDEIGALRYTIPA